MAHPLASLNHQKQFRIIPSTYPPINFFEKVVEASEMDLLFEIESLTNERLREEVGELNLVAPEDRVSGHNASVVMAAFTHIHAPSRFSDGTYGIYYAGLSLETSIRETIHRRERFMQATNEPASELTMRVYEGEVLKPLHDLRKMKDEAYYHPTHYSPAQTLGRTLRSEKSWGLVYRSVRHTGGECIAVFRPPAISLPRQAQHLKYLWNGESITEVVSVKSVLSLKRA